MFLGDSTMAQAAKAKKAKTTRQDRQKKLLKQAMQNPGIRTVMELQAACDRATMGATAALFQEEKDAGYSASSTSGH
jgi:hypothetical protein